MIKTTHIVTSLALLSLTTSMQPAARVATRILATRIPTMLSRVPAAARCIRQPMAHSAHPSTRPPIAIRMYYGIRPFATNNNPQSTASMSNWWLHDQESINDVRNAIPFHLGTPARLTEAALLTQLINITVAEGAKAKARMIAIEEQRATMSLHYAVTHGYVRRQGKAEEEFARWRLKKAFYETALAKLNGTQGKLIDLKKITLPLK